MKQRWRVWGLSEKFKHDHGLQDEQEKRGGQEWSKAEQAGGVS